MPKEKKKRGRRAEEARRKQEGEVKHVDIDMPMEFYDTPGQGSSTDNTARRRRSLITFVFYIQEA